MTNVLEEFEDLCYENPTMSEIITDEEISHSFDGFELSKDSSVNALRRIKAKSQKPLNQIGAELVGEYLTHRTPENWQKVQEFFWFGLKQFAFKFTNNWDDAYDMTIETFIKALESIDTYNLDRAKFSTWLWTICKNNCIALQKKRMRIPVVGTDISEVYDSKMLENSVMNEIDMNDYKLSAGALKRIHADEINMKMYDKSIEEIHRMDGKTGEILKMKLVDNMKIKDIAEILDMNESTVKNYLYKGKDNISRIMRLKHNELYNMYIDTCLPNKE